MRRSDSAAQRGTSISRPTTPLPSGPPGPSRDLTATPGTDGGRRPPRDAGPNGPRRPSPRAPFDLAPPAARLDLRVVGLLRDCGSDPRIANAVRVLGLTGEHGAVWIAAGAAGALGDSERRRAWVRATAVVAAAHLASMGVKRLVRRPRPRIAGAAPLVRTAGQHSFPSSHAASSAAAVVAFGALLPGAATVPVLAAAICVSRLVAGVHYPSDVACGALLGAAAARAGRSWTLGAGGPEATAWHVLPGAAAAARFAVDGAGARSVAAVAAHVLPAATAGGGSRG